MLIDQLKTASLNALKEKDTNARAVLSIIINRYNLLGIEVKSKNQELTDNDLISVIQKVARELIEEKEGYLKVGNRTMVSSIEQQEKILNQYLPKMLSRIEIEKEIKSLDDKSIPNVMKHFKTNFAGKVDMKLVNEVIKTL